MEPPQRLVPLVKLIFIVLHPIQPVFNGPHDSVGANRAFIKIVCDQLAIQAEIRFMQGDHTHGLSPFTQFFLLFSFRNHLRFRF